jgi:hypothetical protein
MSDEEEQLKESHKKHPHLSVSMQQSLSCTTSYLKGSKPFLLFISIRHGCIVASRSAAFPDPKASMSNEGLTELRIILNFGVSTQLEELREFKELFNLVSSTFLLYVRYAKNFLCSSFL